MSLTFRPADEEVIARMRSAMETYFEGLDILDLRIELLMCWADNGARPVKLHGSPALATIKILGEEDRAGGSADVRIKVDAVRYFELSERSQEALFAHELYHLIPVFDQGKVRRDQFDRPVLRSRPDDWSITGFQRVAEWYGEDSVERHSYRRLGEMLAQGDLDFDRAGNNGEAPAPKRSRKGVA